MKTSRVREKNQKKNQTAETGRRAAFVNDAFVNATFGNVLEMSGAEMNMSVKVFQSRKSPRISKE